MTITAPVDLELQHDDIQVTADDDITIVADDRGPADTSATLTLANAGREPLLPFLVLGVLNLIAMLVVALVLAL